MVKVALFCVTVAGFLKITLKALNIPFKKGSFARKSQMWWHGRGNGGGSWPPTFPRSFNVLKRVFL